MDGKVVGGLASPENLLKFDGPKRETGGGGRGKEGKNRDSKKNQWGFLGKSRTRGDLPVLEGLPGAEQNGPERCQKRHSRDKKSKVGRGRVVKNCINKKGRAHRAPGGTYFHR